MDRCTRFAGGTAIHRLFGGKSAGCVAASFDNEDDMHRFLGDPISIVDIDFRTLYLDW